MRSLPMSFRGWFSCCVPADRSDLNRKKLLPAVVLAGLACFGLTVCATGAVIHVPADQATIRLGLTAAVGGDTVLVAPGVYHEHDLPMKAGVCLRGESGQAGNVVIDAQRLGRVLLCQGMGSDTRIESLTLTGGTAPQGNGGGIYCNNASPFISGCVVTGSFAASGGSAVFCLYSSPVITDCIFADNLESMDGGAFFCQNSSPVFTRCLLANNACQFLGGAIFSAEGSPQFYHCTLAGNQGRMGGSIFVCYGSHAILEDTIVASSILGEGVYVYEDRTHPSDVALACCDVFGNQGGNYGGDIQDQTGINGNFSLSAEFCDPAAENYHVLAGSPCLPENNTCQVLIGAYGQGCDAPAATPVDPRADSSLSWSVPNPFRPGCVIELRLPAAGPVSLAIHDVSGRLIRHLLAGTVNPAGNLALRWDGRDDAGRSLPSGIYFCRLQAGAQAEVRKTLLLE